MSLAGDLIAHGRLPQFLILNYAAGKNDPVFVFTPAYLADEFHSTISNH